MSGRSASTGTKASAADKSAIMWDAAPAWTLVRTIGGRGAGAGGDA